MVGMVDESPPVDDCLDSGGWRRLAAIYSLQWLPKIVFAHHYPVDHYQHLPFDIGQAAA
jgi:hypothetical protein